MTDIQLSILMPALNEEESIQEAIEETLKAFDQHNISGEIIVVNDGSTDRTKEIVVDRFGKNSRVHLLNHETPKGIGGSFWDGVKQARGDFVCLLPGDNENDPTEIFRYFGLLSQVDIVIPFVFNKEVRSLFRNALSFVYRFIINSTFMVNFNYTNGTVLYRKNLLKELKFQSTSFFFQTDILVRLVKKGYLFAEVPYRLDVRTGNTSKAVSFPSLMQVIRGYFRLIKDIYYHKQGQLEESFSKGSTTQQRQPAKPS